MSSPDVDGRTPLHWASYKGYANTLRLLIVLEASLTLGDREGCTPLHWSAIRGNSEACTVLLQVQTFKSKMVLQRNPAFITSRSTNCGPTVVACIDVLHGAVQAGAGSVLNAPDATGMVPAQLAREKGHRFLAHYLEEYATRHVNKSRCVVIEHQPHWQWHMCVQLPND